MATVRIRLLGGFSVSVGERAVPDSAWSLRKARSVVKLLALAPRHAVHRDVLCDTLWPDRDPAAAQNNLHQALYVARRALEAAGADGREALGLRGELIALCAEGEVSVDAERFEAAARSARGAHDARAYRRALELYGGELLPEDRYEPWVEPRRVSLAQLQLALLVELATLQSEAGELAGAVESLRQAVATDPLYEPANRALMRVLADGGRRQEALAEYERLRSALREAVGADPDPETRRLYRDLLTGSLAFEPGPGELPPAPPRRHNLPHEATSFVGRERELREIDRLLARTRLLTLSGAGGSGKSRLARELAGRRVADFEHGAWLVQLAPLSDPELVVSEAASTLGLALPDRGGAEAALVAQLGDRSALVVLDNCEHLIDACAVLATAIMRSCPGITLVATSREPLRIEGEVAWRVPSLALPDLERLPVPAELVRLGVGAAVRRTGRGRRAGLHGRREQRPQRGRALPSARRHAARARAGGGPGRDVLAGADPGAAAQHARRARPR